MDHQGDVNDAAFLQLLAEVSPDGLWVIDFAGRTIYANPRIAAMYGIPTEELPNLVVYDVLDDEGKSQFVEHLALLDSGSVLAEDAESLFVRRDGTSQWVLVNERLIVHPRTGERCVLLRISDFSRRRQERVDLARAQDELALARDQAMAASRQKSEFMATMSHEVRTPLNGVLGLNELLLGTNLDEQQTRLAAGIQQSGQHLLGLINDVLDFSKIEAGRLLVERVEFDVREVLGQVADTFRETALAKGLEFSMTWEAGVPSRVSGDPTRISQVLANLLSNAVKFTDNGSIRVVVRAEQTDDATRLVVSIADTGIGISGEAADVFAPFQQADSSTTRKFGGSGLGLAISRELARAMGGDIDFTSHLGCGSEFRFTALVTTPVERPDQLPASARLTPTVTPCRTLVVEDNEVNQLVASGMLESLGHTVDVAPDGLVAVEMLSAAAYDVVFMDIQMPRMDGYATAARIRAVDGPNQNTPIVAMTANALDGERQRCLDAGMDDYLTKPINRDEVALTLATWRWRGPSSSVLDTARLDALRDMDPGNTTYLERVLDRFRSSGPAHVAAIRDATSAADLSFAAHKLVGSASNLGLNRVAKLARELELRAGAGQPDDVAPIIAELATALAEGLGALESYRVGRVGLEPTTQGL